MEKKKAKNLIKVRKLEKLRKAPKLLRDLQHLLQHHKLGNEAAALVVTIESTGMLATPSTDTEGDQNVSVTLIYMPRKPQADA